MPLSPRTPRSPHYHRATHSGDSASNGSSSSNSSTDNHHQQQQQHQHKFEEQAQTPQSPIAGTTPPSSSKRRVRHSKSYYDDVQHASHQESLELQRLKDGYDKLYGDWARSNEEQMAAYKQLTQQESKLIDKHERRVVERYKMQCIERITSKAWHKSGEDKLIRHLKKLNSELKADATFDDPGTKNRSASAPSEPSSSAAAESSSAAKDLKRRRYIWR